MKERVIKTVALIEYKEAAKRRYKYRRSAADNEQYQWLSLDPFNSIAHTILRNQFCGSISFK